MGYSRATLLCFLEAIADLSAQIVIVRLVGLSIKSGLMQVQDFCDLEGLSCHELGTLVIPHIHEELYSKGVLLTVQLIPLSFNRRTPKQTDWEPEPAEPVTLSSNVPNVNSRSNPSLEWNGPQCCSESDHVTFTEEHWKTLLRVFAPDLAEVLCIDHLPIRLWSQELILSLYAVFSCHNISCELMLTYTSHYQRVVLSNTACYTV